MKLGTELADRSVLALKFSAGCSNFSNVICVVTLMLLVHYFGKDNNHAIGIKIKIFGLLPIFTSIILNTWFGMLGNNSIWSSINDTFPFIDEYCLESMRIVLLIAHVDLYAVSIFILMRTYYFFDTATTDQVKVNKIIYYALIFLLSTVTILYCIMAMAAPSDIFRVTIYHNNNHQKQCELSFNAKSNNIFPALAI
eukprot:325246_1